MDRFSSRCFAVLLALLLAAACALPAVAAAVPPAQSIPFAEVTPPEDAAALPPYRQPLDAEPQIVSDKPLRAIIELEKPSLLEMGYDAADAAGDGEAAAYNKELEQYQTDVITAIEAATGEPLEVVWRLTIVADLLSAWIQPAQTEIIAAVPGVRSVQAEAVFLPTEGGDSESEGEETGEDPSSKAADGTAAGGVPAAEAAGGDPAVIAENSAPAAITETGAEPNYTGAGQRIAIIDTGVDEWHRSLNSGAWIYALQKDGFDLSSPDFLDGAGIEEAVKQGLLTITQRHPEATAADLAGHGEAVTVSGRSLHKIAFGANYSSTYPYDDIAHHERSEHGSHVAGIAAANRYVPDEDCWDPASGKTTGTPAVYENAVDAVKMQGQAPDAQLLVMQIFTGESCTESDFIAAIQDALILGADTINLSLGSNAPGATFSQQTTFQSIVNGLVNSGTVVAMSGGNSSYFTSCNA